MLLKLKWINVFLRALMEFGIIAALAYWGYQSGSNTNIKIILGIGAPLVGFGFWGIIDFHQAGSLSELLRLLQELVVSGLAVIGFYTTGQYLLAWILGIISIIHHILVYTLGETLIKK